MFYVLCLTNTGFVQCYSLGSLKVCCTLKLVLYCALFSNFLFCVLCLTNIGFGQCFSFCDSCRWSSCTFCKVIASGCTAPLQAANKINKDSPAQATIRSESYLEWDIWGQTGRTFQQATKLSLPWEAVRLWACTTLLFTDNVTVVLLHVMEHTPRRKELLQICDLKLQH